MKREEAVWNAEVYTDDGPEYRYRIVSDGPNADGIVDVKPSDDSYGKMDRFHIDDLYLYQPEALLEVAVQAQSKLDEAKNAFEKAFEALREAERIVEEAPIGCGLYGLDRQGMISLKELEHTVEKNGWSSSSLWC